jgi:hydroxyisourate hydrolase
LNKALDQLNRLSLKQAEAEFLKCCGSTRWARELTDARPFADIDNLVETADSIWRSLTEEDWLEAFRAHPKIGEQKAAAVQTEQARNWSAQEQSGTKSAGAETKAALAEGNQKYEERFGFIFIVCATGKSSEEMLAVLNSRLQNDPKTELPVAAEEQRKITRLRLEKHLGSLYNQMSTISTHILDTSRGQPAAGVGVKLEALNAGEGWSQLAQAQTDEDGRVKAFDLSEPQLAAGTYRLVFAVGGYFEALNQESFYPEVVVNFRVEGGPEHYHVPLLISPFGYSTYRGS